MFPLLTAAALAVLLAGQAHASVIALYEFNSSFNPTDPDTDSLASSLGLGSAFAGNTSWDGGGNGGTTPPALRINNEFISSTTEAASISSGTEYLEFTVTATTSGLKLQLNGGSVTANFTGQQASQSFWALRSSLDGYGSDIGSAQTCAQQPSYAFNSVSLSGSQFNNLDAVTFRMYVWQTHDDDIRFDNITLNGVVEVPEVGTVWISFLVIAGAILSTKRFGKKNAL